MPAKLCYGQPDGAAYQLRLSRAYCEGRDHAVGGGLVTDVPFPTWDVESKQAWEDGFNSHLGGVAQPQDCCQHPPTAAP